MPRTISDAQDDIQRFIDEARACAQTKCHQSRLGFAAMLTILPVMLAVGEALHAESPASDDHGPGNLDLFQQFLSKMTDTSSWLRPRVPVTLSAAGILCQTRDSLAHQMALPDNVRLVETTESADAIVQHSPETYVLVPGKLVAAVEEAIRDIAARNPNLVLDPQAATRHRQRGVGARFFHPSGETSSASWDSTVVELGRGLDEPR